jgi:hypothetical protein
VKHDPAPRPTALPSRSSTRAGALVLAALIAVGVVLGGDTRGAAQDADPDRTDAQTDEAELVTEYAPIVFVRSQPTACGEGEPFAPAPVESVLGRPDVVLRGPDGSVVTTGPTASDLFGLGEGHHIDIPGNPLDPGCDYERWWNAMAADMPATTYARVASDPEHPDQLVVQYWFWWVFNDWNDKHEGDWEMMQLVFDVPTAAEALDAEPTLVMFAQHEGGQFREWDDERLIRDGPRVAYFASAGSHAGYFSSNRWFGTSAQTGFGCDDTRAALDRLDPAVVLLPTDGASITSADDPFAWLTYTGRWGEKKPSFNNGPQGPTTKTSWGTPVSWVEDEGRPGAVALPTLGSQVTDFFCVASTEGSLLFISLLDSPQSVIVSTLVVLALAGFVLSRTRWSPSDPFPVRSPRRAGQLFVAAFRLQRSLARAYGSLAAVVLAVGFLAALVQSAVVALAPAGDMTDLVDESAVWVLPVALLAGAAITIPMTAFVRATVAAIVSAADAGREVTFRDAVRTVRARRGGFRTALVLQLAAGAVIVVPPLGLPALYVFTRWAVATPIAIAGSTTVRQAVRGSYRLTKGNTLRTVMTVAISNAAFTVIGPLVGTIVLLLTGSGFAVANLVSALVSVVLLPWAATVIALLHADLLARTSEVGPAA